MSQQPARSFAAVAGDESGNQNSRGNPNASFIASSQSANPQPHQQQSGTFHNHNSHPPPASTYNTNTNNNNNKTTNALGPENPDTTSSPDKHTLRTFSPNPHHTPKTSSTEQSVYVLTLHLTSSLSQPLNQMRKAYFPPHLNKTPAHLTLFHALPHSQLDIIETHLSTLTTTTRAFRISTGKPFRMRRGVGVSLDAGSKEAKGLRNELRGQWEEFLSEQDATSGWRPHWTVMNKVDEEEKVEGAFNMIRRDLFENMQEGRAVGVELWRYDRGAWVWEREFRFRG